MNYLLEVCLLALTLTTNIVFRVAAQSSANQRMHEGISVQMASSKNAVPVPDADNADAWIVTISNTGGIFFGTGQVTSDSLKEEMISHPHNRYQKLYIKVDARRQYANVERVLIAARAAKFFAPVLLTARLEAQEKDAPVLPTGLEVAVGSPPPSNSLTVQIMNSSQRLPTLKINNEQIQWGNLQDRLGELLRKQREPVVAVTADGGLPFAAVVHVIDVCRQAETKVILATPEL
jgi:biopolymer transport protein ExbD